jgi:hypothetical protein
MNPLDWKRQHQVPAIAFCAAGALAGIFFAWMESTSMYWPWPVIGAGSAGLAFYGVQSE